MTARAENRRRGCRVRRGSKLHSRGPKETWAIAREVAESYPGSIVIALHGELGSGKTCFVQGLARALGILQPVTSPTFTLVNAYRGSRFLYHIDLYRVADASETLSFALPEYLEADGIKAVEWAERAENLIPADALHVEFSVPSSRRGRTIMFR